MIRRFYIALLVAIFGIGPIPLQAFHLWQANQQWNRQIAATVVPTQSVPSHHPLTRLPVVPKHDPATCAICINLHAPMVAEKLAPPALDIFPKLTTVRLSAADHLESRWSLATSCRGPPTL